MATPIILDRDPGHDDAIALLLALASPEVELLGVTTTYGNQETRFRSVAIELESELCRGRTVVDLWRRTERAPNAHVGVDLDTDRFFELVVERIGQLG